MESGNSRETKLVRLYAEDVELLNRKVRAEQVVRKRAVSLGEIIHEQLAQLRIDERAGNQ